MFQGQYFSGVPSILRGAQSVLSGDDSAFRLLSLDTTAPTLSEALARQGAAFESVLRDRLSGVLVYAIGGAHCGPWIRQILDRGIPIVMVDSYIPNMPTDFVGVDDLAAARDLTKYLISLGHRRIAHVALQEPTTTTARRMEGYLQALTRSRIPPAPELVYSIGWTTPRAASIEDAAAHFLSLPAPPTAIFAHNDVNAHALVACLEQRGISVPKQISVCGFDNLDRFSPRPSRLTTVHIPFERIGEMAAELLLERVSDPSSQRIPRQVMLPASLVISSSTAPPPDRARNQN